jgi:hypothetical protein
MRYKGKACEIVCEKEVFGQRIAWIRLLNDEAFRKASGLEQRAGG